MQTTGDQVMVHFSGRRMMTYESAAKVANAFRENGGFTEVRVCEFGCETGCWYVQLWSVNARAGNRNLTTVDHVPAVKELKLIAKKALGKAKDRDLAALGRIASERAMDRE